MRDFTDVISSNIAEGDLMTRDIQKIGEYCKDDKKPSEVSIKKFVEDYQTFYDFFSLECLIFKKLDEIKHKRKLQTVDSLLMGVDSK